MSTITPFKIHDENSSVMKTGGFSTAKKGLKMGNHNNMVSFKETSNGDGLKGNNMLVKSQRKALSSLSTSQVNSRPKTPFEKQNSGGFASNVKSGFKIAVDSDTSLAKAKLVQGEKANAKPKVSFQPSRPEMRDSLPPVEDMICSSISVVEDPYDIMLRSAAYAESEMAALAQDNLGFDAGALDPDNSLGDYGFGLDTDFSQDIGSSGCDDLLNYFPVIDTADHLSFDATTEGGVSAEEGNQNMLMQFPPDQDVQQEREQDVKQEQERVQDMKRKQEVGFEVKEYQGHKPELADGAYEL